MHDWLPWEHGNEWLSLSLVGTESPSWAPGWILIEDSQRGLNKIWQWNIFVP